VGMFEQGTVAMRAQLAEARAYGLYLDGTQNRVVAEAADSQDRLKSAFDGLALQLGATLAPAFEVVAGWVTDLTTYVTQAIPKLQQFGETFLGIQVAVEDLSNDAVSSVLIGQIQSMDVLNNKIAEQRNKLKGHFEQQGERIFQEALLTDLLKEQAEKQERINALIAESAKRKADAKKPAEAPTVEDDEGADAARDAAEAKLKLLTDVYAERERLFALEAQQEHDWATTMAEERERMHVEEVAQEQEWANVLAEQREAARDMDLQSLIQHEGLLTAAKREGELARANFTKMSSGQQVESVLGSLQQMTAGVAQHSRKAFEVNKLAGIANAVVNTAQGVTKALASYPPPLSFVMAAAQAAAGAAQISAIKSTTFQGGGGGTTPSAAGSTPTVNSQPAQQSAPGQLIRIEGSGDRFSRQQVMTLIDQINEAQGDGKRIVFAG
jgi:hypothetical protein